MLLTITFKFIKYQIDAMIHVLGIIAAFVAGLADLIGGWLAQNPRITKNSFRYFMGFAAGTVIATAFFEVIPNISFGTGVYLLAFGFFFFYLLERVMMIHACGESECETHTVGTISVFGMALDNIVDGAGIAIGFLTSTELGIIITIAVIIHEIPQGLSSGIIMKAQNYSKRKIYSVLIIAALLYPVGAFLSSFIPENLYAATLAFIAGDFLYIGASDLLPEAHKKFNFKVIGSVFAGVLMVLILSVMAPGA